MKRQTDREMSQIRESWSQAEQENRRQLAGAMQLQLHQMVFLAELSSGRPVVDSEKVEVASAC